MAVIVTTATKAVTKFKLDMFQELIRQEKQQIWPSGTAFIFLYSCNILFVIIAFSAVYIEPLASGSGITFFIF